MVTALLVAGLTRYLGRPHVLATNLQYSLWHALDWGLLSKIL